MPGTTQDIDPAPLLEVDLRDLAGNLTDDLDLLVGPYGPGGCEPFGELSTSVSTSGQQDLTNTSDYFQILIYDADGQVPCQIDGGLKCFGHPIGATGLRMLYEMYLQLQGRAGERQLQRDPVFGLTHNLGGFPSQNVSSVTIVGQVGA
jgi:hypothetical protein